MELETGKLSCNTTNMTRLADALESGEYPQGGGTLRYTDNGLVRYCCAGVACEISREETGGTWESYPEGDVFAAGGMGDAGYLVPAVITWLGIDPSSVCATAIPVSNPGYETAVDMNDSDVPFTEIAAELRRSYL